MKQQIITAGQSSREIIRLKSSIRSLELENVEYRNRLDFFEEKIQLNGSYEQLACDTYQRKMVQQYGSPARAAASLIGKGVLISPVRKF